MDSEFWQDAEHRVERAKDLLRRRKWPAALEELRAAAEIDPTNPVHHYELGRCLELLGRDDEATDAFGRAVDLDSNEPSYLCAYGTGLLSQQLWREAAEVFGEAETLDPAHEPAYVNRILAYTELGDHDRAEQMFYLAQQLREDSPEAFYNIGRSLALRQKHERAVWCWRRVLDLCHGQRQAEPDADAAVPSHGVSPDTLTTQAYLRIAESLSAVDDHENARRHYLHALARDGRHIEALLGLAELLLDMRRFDAAGQRITRAVRLDPDDPRGHYLAGRRLFALGRLDEAGVALRRATELDPTLAGGHLLLAKVALRQYDLDEVLRRCRSEMLLRPNDPATLRDLSNLLFEAAEFDDAVACLKRLVAIDPGDSEAWQNLGVAECSRGQLMQGVVASRRALKLDAANLPAANNLALAFLDMGELDAAAKVIRDGLALDPRSRLMRRLRFRLRLCRLRRRVMAAVGRVSRRED